MSDTNETSTAGKRQRIAQRDTINADGVVVERMEEATGARYTYKSTGGSVERQFGAAGDAATMCAIFGWLTKVGNVVNSIVNADDYDGSDPIPDAVDWNADLDAGIWRERQEPGKRAPKWDKDLLASAIVQNLEQAGKLPSGKTVANYREQLNDAKYFAKARAAASVLATYQQMLAERGVKTKEVSVDELA